MSSRVVFFAVLLPLVAAAPPAAAQSVNSPERIDLLIEQESEREAALRRECENKQDAATIAGEIVVCGQRENDAASAGWDQEEWENRYAAETRGRDPVDPCGPMCGIFKGKPTVGGLCIPGLQKCPPPPALIVDLAALPQAPPGSDADRIARGLAPLGDAASRSDKPPETLREQSDSEALGLPSPPDFAEVEPLNRVESVEPEAQR